MSINVNSVVVGGRLGRDPEVKFSANSEPVCRFSIAVDEGSGDKRHTNWVDCTAFGKTAESVGQYLTKGAEAVVEGRLSIRKYQDKDGNQRTGWSVIASRVHFGAKPQGGGTSAPAASEDAGDIPW